MKKLFILVLFTAILPTAMLAQFRVTSDGKATIARPQNSTYTTLGVNGSGDFYSGSGYKMGIHSNVNGSANFLVGVSSAAVGDYGGTGRAIALSGTAGRATSGYNYGVLGYLEPNNNGAAVYGSTSHPLGFNLGGQYAGYFDGDAYVNGSLYTTEVLTPSDMRLRDHVESLSGTRNETLDGMMNLSVMKFRSKARQEERSDTARTAVSETQVGRQQLHYGLSAEELQKVYPGLVVEGQDGYLAVNYVELVPLLIRSIQELKQELDEVRGGGADAAASRSVSTAVAATKTASDNVLYQNTPNPFREQTTIRFRLADDARDAAICIFDMTGKLLRKVPVSLGQNSVTVNSWELGEGMFLYTFIVDGREIDTKRMVITK